MLYASVMGTWGPGPFDNDAAADFIDELQASSSRLVAKTLRAIAGAPVGKYIDVDEGGAGWAACEMVAIAFGHGGTAALDDNILDLAAKLRPKEEQRLIALQAAPPSAELVVLQAVGPGEIAVFDGTCPDSKAALEYVKSRPARRVPCSVSKLLRRGALLGNVPLRKDL